MSALMLAVLNHNEDVAIPQERTRAFRKWRPKSARPSNQNDSIEIIINS